jgi:hypothetical protein
MDMTNVEVAGERLVTVSKQGETLVVRRRTPPYEMRVIVVLLLSVVTVGVFLSAVSLEVSLPLRLGIILAGLVLVLAALRMSDINMYRPREVTFRFCGEDGPVERNGEEIALVREVDHILVRRILREENQRPDESDYALVVALDNTKRFTIVESEGVRAARGQMLQAAEEIARYLGVSVREGERLPGEEWMDR